MQMLYIKIKNTCTVGIWGVVLHNQHFRQLKHGHQTVETWTPKVSEEWENIVFHSHNQKMTEMVYMASERINFIWNKIFEKVFLKKCLD